MTTTIAALLQPGDRLVSSLKVSRPGSPQHRHLAIISRLSEDYRQQAAVLDVEGRHVSNALPIYASTKHELLQDPTHGFILRIDDFKAPVSDVSTCAAFLGDLKRLHTVAVQQIWLPETHPFDWIKPYQATYASNGEQRKLDAVSRSYWTRTHRNGLDSCELQDAKHDWIVRHLRDREDSFSKKESITIFASTFNVNNQLPTHDVMNWLHDVMTAQPELVVLGFQELDTGAQSLVVFTPHRQNAWLGAIEKALKQSRVPYQTVHSCQLVGMLLVVLARSDVTPHITDVSANSVATGLLGFVANKGAVAIRLRYKDTLLCFLNCHLAAFTNMTAKRNADLDDIARNLSFPVSDAYDWTATPDLRPGAERPVVYGSQALSVWDHHHLIWFGDLNYRLEMARDEATHLIERKNWRALLRHDQLSNERKRDRHLLHEFHEPDIGFEPSFKYDLGTDRYDTSEKQRTPSYTDRILWLSLRADEISAVSYKAHRDVRLSDHKPVSALLKVPVHATIPDMRERAQQELLDQLDKYNYDGQVQLTFEPSASITFDSLTWDATETRVVTLRNTSDTVAAPWVFDRATLHGPAELRRPRVPPWLTVSPTEGFLAPGESVTIRVEVNVDDETAGKLNLSTEPEPARSLSDILLFSSGDQSHFYLTLDVGKYERTVFANSLESLARLPSPIRKATPEEFARIENGELKVKDGIPEPVDGMIQYLSKHAIHTKDLFALPADQELFKLVRDALDTGEPFDESLYPPRPTKDDTVNDTRSNDPKPEATIDLGRLSIDSKPLTRSSVSLVDLPPSSSASASTTVVSSGADSDPTADDSKVERGVHAVAEAFVRFLDSLPEPVVPRSFYSKACGEASESLEMAYVLAGQLPPVHSNTLVYIAAFLRAYINESDDPPSTADRLATAFSRILLKPPLGPKWTAGGASPLKAYRFVLTLIHGEL